MKLTELKSKTCHYFTDELGRKQGEFKAWYTNGRLLEHCFFVDNKRHGEYRWWYENGQLKWHAFYVDNKILIDFLKTPELYPTSEADRLVFTLKYGNAPLLNTTPHSLLSSHADSPLI